MKITVEMDTSGLLLWTEKNAVQQMKTACDLTEKILSSRLQHFGFDKDAIEIKRQDSVYRQEISIWGFDEKKQDNGRIYSLLQGSGQLEFWETYDLSELAEDFQRVDRSAQDQGDTLGKYLLAAPVYGDEMARTKRPASPLLGLSRDTGNVMRILRKHIEKLPPHVQFAWMLKSPNLVNGNDQNYFSLILLKGDSRADTKNDQSIFAFEKRVKSKNTPSLSGSIISTAKAEKDEYAGFHIEFSMVEPAAKKWAKLTRENKGKCIAIVFDGYVYSYPTVESEINNGNCWLTGNFTKDEAKDMAAILQAGQLPLPVKIVAQEFK